MLHWSWHWSWSDLHVGLWNCQLIWTCIVNFVQTTTSIPFVGLIFNLWNMFIGSPSCACYVELDLDLELTYCWNLSAAVWTTRSGPSAWYRVYLLVFLGGRSRATSNRQSFNLDHHHPRPSKKVKVTCPSNIRYIKLPPLRFHFFPFIQSMLCSTSLWKVWQVQFIYGHKAKKLSPEGSPFQIFKQ